MIKEVVIKSEKENKNVSRDEMSVAKLDPKSIESVPVFFGEKDMIKTLQMPPGVKSAGVPLSLISGQSSGVQASANPNSNWSNKTLGYFGAFSSTRRSIVVK